MGHQYESKYPNEKGEIFYTKEENETWSILINRQNEAIKKRAYKGFIEGLEILNLPLDRIPQHHEVNKVLGAKTGWGIKPVPALIPATEFFTLLSNKIFPAASFIRIREELNYIEEPDIFHEIYGHCPLITNQDYADFMQKVGALGLEIEPKKRKYLFRLFWFTIEFGLMNTKDGLVSYGGGILSSIHETVSALEQEDIKRVPFDILTALRTDYRIDIPQPLYFVINDLKEVYESLNHNPKALIDKAIELGDLEPLFPPRPNAVNKTEREVDC